MEDSKSMSRRSFLGLPTVILAWAGGGFNFPLRTFAQPNRPTNFVAPPHEETPQIASAINQVEKLLKTGRTSTSDILSNPAYLSLHEWPRFRLSIRDNASKGVLTMVSTSESGTRLRFKGSVVDGRGGGVPAQVYVYQTSSRGWYSDKAPHISGNSGDQRHARLFGYLVCDESGQFEVETIRPAGYPDSSLPAHIHVEIRPAWDSRDVIITEVRFADDPRLTPEARKRSQQERFIICDVAHKPDGREEVSAVFRTTW